MIARSTIALLILGGCLAGPEPAPQSNRSRQELIAPLSPDGTDEAVVALLYGSGSVFCTGTLISPSVIATAAHCVDMFGNDPNVSAFFGTYTEADGRRISIKRKQQHLMWNGSVNNPGPNYDVAMLLLDFPNDPSLAVPLTTEDANDHVGEPLRRVGFGINESGSIDGRKRAGTTVLHTVEQGRDTYLAGDSEVYTCSGDSGGPGFLTVDGVEYLQGVHSFGPVGCGPTYNGDTRVELYADDFIIPWIDANDPRCAQDFVCAPIGCSADPDCTPCGPDGTCSTGCGLPDIDCHPASMGEICKADSQCDTGLCVWYDGSPESRFCTRPCNPQGDDCPPGMGCRDFAQYGPICYYTDPPPGVLGDSCTEATDCGSYICEEGTCVIPCDIGAGLLCPQGFECSTLDSSNYYWHAVETDDDGGCDAAGSPGGSLIGLLVVAALMARRRRQASTSR